MTETCPICGKTFETNHPLKKYCSHECYLIHAKQNLKKYREEQHRLKKEKVKKCPTCGKEFKPDPPQKKYCSPECAKAGKLERQRQWRLKHPEKVRKSARRYYWKDHLTYKKICPTCKKTFTTTKRNQKYCCYECWEKRPKKYPCSDYPANYLYQIPDELCFNCSSPKCRFYD